MNKNIDFKKIFILTFVFFSILMAPTVQAESEPHGAFYIEPHLPANQKNSNSGFYDLVMEPEMIQTLYLDIVNKGDVEMIASIDFRNATTGLNAEKNFESKVKPDESLLFSLQDNIELSDTTLVIEPYSKKTISIVVKAPEKNIDGVFLGGINVTADKQVDKDRPTNSIDIKNRISYLVALQVSMNDVIIEPNLNYLESSSELIDLTPQFVSYLQNDKALIMNDITVHGSITNKEGKTVAEINKNSGGIYPNSQFKVAYKLKEEKIKAGEYNLKLRITSKDDYWEWNDTIIVDADTAKDLNDNALKVKKSNVFFYSLLLIILILIALIIILVKKLRDNKKER